MERRLRHFPARVRTIWPRVLVALVVLLSGIVNLVGGLRSFRAAHVEQIVALGNLGGTLPALGHSAETILGASLICIGLGLFWGLQTAWAFALLITAIIIGVDIALGRWGLLVIPAIIFVGLILARRSFTRRTVFATYLVSVVSIMGVLAFGTIGSYVLSGGFNPPIKTLTNGFFYTITTLSTVGSVYQPNTSETKMFEAALIVIGVGVFASTIVSAFGPAISQEMNRLFKPESTAMDQRDHIVLLGEGPIARHTAEELSRRSIPFVQVTPEQGDAAREETLTKAGVPHARMVVVALDDDNANAMATLVAKHLNSKVRVIAVASHANAIGPLKLAGADVVFAPSVAGSRLLAGLIDGETLPAQFGDLLQT